MAEFEKVTKAKAGPKHAIDLGGRRQAAQYISEMTLELRNIAKAHELLSLQGLLEIAYYEAFTAATQNELFDHERAQIEKLNRATVG